MRQYYIQSKACNSIPFGMAKMTHQTISFWYYCTIPIPIPVHFQISQFSFFTLMYPSASTLTKKSRLHALGQTVCQLSAGINQFEFDLISCWVILGDTSHKFFRGKFNSQALVLHLARNLARQVASQGAAICEVQMQYRALALFIPFFD